MTRFLPEYEIIESALKSIVYEGCSEEVGSLLLRQAINWERFKELLSYHEIAPLIHIALKPYQNILPENIVTLLSNSYNSSLVNNLIKEREYKIVNAVFEKEGIDIVPIKGMAFMFDLYDKYPVRPMTDIDVLIKREDYTKSADALQRAGYTKDLEGLKEEYWLEKQCHVVFLKKQVLHPVRLELHHGLDFKRQGKDILACAWDRTIEAESDNGKIRLLSPEDTLFSLALHQRRFGKMFCLKYAMDAALIMRKYENKLSWDYIRKACREYRLNSCLYFFLLQSGILMGKKKPYSGIENLSISRVKKNMIKGFISSNMGSFPQNRDIKSKYVKSHFFLYDSVIEPILYILNIPLEQFAKYYGLEAYAEKTKFLYKFRFLYFLRFLKWCK